MKINTNHSNIKFEKEIANVKRWLSTRLQGACGYSTETVLDRLMQYIVTVSLPIYAKTVFSLSQESEDCFPVTGTVLDVGVAKIELGAGKVTINIRQWFKEVMRFAAHWSVCLWAIIFVRRSVNYDSDVTLLYGVGEESIYVDGSDERFINYCKKGPITPLKSKNKLYIQFSSSNKPDNHNNYYYCKRPLLSFLLNTKLGISCRARLFISHVLLFFTFLFSIVRSPLISLLAKEIAYSSIIKELDRCKKIKSIILTCSSYSEQQICVQELNYATVHMVWYSQAWKPNVYKDKPIKSYVPSLTWIYADIHWVWTNGFANYLISLGLKAKFEIIGSIVWYLPRFQETEKSNIQIIVFDVSPFSDDIALKYGHITNYHHPDNLLKFINDILFVRDEIETELNVTINLLLKTKRGYRTAYDKNYFGYLDKLSSSGEIILKNPSENIYSLVSSSRLVIAYPFTSPAYIADELKVPSIYYDPTKAICKHDFESSESLIKFINDRKLLLETIINILKVDSNNKY